MNKIEPERYVSRRPMLLAGLRQHHTIAQASETIPKQWLQLQSLGKIKGQVGTTAYGAVCGSSLNGFEYLAGFEVESFTGLSEEVGKMRIPEQYYVIFLHRDHISTIQKTWALIFNDWVPRSNIKPAETPCLELYDEYFNPKTGLGIVEIFFPVEKLLV